MGHANLGLPLLSWLFLATRGNSPGSGVLSRQLGGSWRTVDGRSVSLLTVLWNEVCAGAPARGSRTLTGVSAPASWPQLLLSAQRQGQAIAFLSLSSSKRQALCSDPLFHSAGLTAQEHRRVLSGLLPEVELLRNRGRHLLCLHVGCAEGPGAPGR